MGFLILLVFIRPDNFNLYAAATASAVGLCSYIKYKKIKVGRWVDFANPFFIGLLIPVLMVRVLKVMV
jgi:hypothetical protein